MGFILKLLGLIDLLAAGLLFLSPLQLFPVKFVLIVAACLALKALMFWGGPVNAFDVIIAAYLAFTLVVAFPLVNVLVGLYLVLKGLYSMF